MGTVWLFISSVLDSLKREERLNRSVDVCIFFSYQHFCIEQQLVCCTIIFYPKQLSQMKLGPWKDALAHKTLINTELYMIVQDRKHEPNIKAATQPQVEHRLTSHLHNYICRAIHKPKYCCTVIFPEVIELTTSNSVVYNMRRVAQFNYLKLTLLCFSSMGPEPKKPLCLHI